MQLKGRHWLGLWLLAFLVVAAVVVERQAAALATAQRLGALRNQRSDLEAARADLERRILVASSGRVLIPRAQALGLRFADSSTMFALPARNSEER